MLKKQRITAMEGKHHDKPPPYSRKGERQKTWGDYHREAIAAGMDDASACHAADTAVP